MRKLLPFVLAVSLALTACSGGDDDDSTAESADTAADSTTTVPASEWIVDATAVRGADGAITISWGGTPDAEIRWGTTPDDTATVLTAATGATATVDDPKPGSRVFYEIVPDGYDEGVVVAERVLPLEGQPNFRDLGGYVAADGRRVKWGQIYRSGELGNLTDADLAYVESAGIKLVCDYRTEGEVALLADKLPPGVETVLLPVGGEGTDASVLRQQILAGDLSGLSPDLLITANAQFVTDFTAEYTTTMQRIMDPGSRPALVHCTAGKDRAGFGAAVVLLALGVPEETVMQDYLLTNEFRAAANEAALTAVEAIAGDAGPLEPLLEAREEYLQAAFDAMNTEFGSIDGYLRDGLGITDEARAEFQDQMLE